jgi:hypothetical protein
VLCAMQRFVGIGLVVLRAGPKAPFSIGGSHGWAFAG